MVYGEALRGIEEPGSGDHPNRPLGSRMRSRMGKTILLASGGVAQAASMIGMFAALSRILNVEGYAAYRQALLVYTTVTPLLALGLPQAIYYFMPLQRDRARGVLVENILLLLAMGAVFLVAVGLGADRWIAELLGNDGLRLGVLLVAVHTLFALPIMSVPACLMAQDRVGAIPIFNVLSRGLVVAVVIGLAVWKGTFIAAILGLAVSSAIVFVPALALMLDATTGTDWVPRRSGFRRQLAYSVPLGASGVVGILTLNLNQIIVSHMCTAEEFAIYSNGAIELPIVAILTASINGVLLPEFVDLIARNDRAQVVQIWQRAVLRALMLLVPIMVYFLWMAEPAMRFLFSARFEEAAEPFRILLLLLLMRCIPANLVFLAADRSRLVLLRGVVALILNVVVCWIAIGAFGHIGAAWALVFVMYLWSVPFTLTRSAHILGTSVRELFPWADSGRVIALAGVVGLLVAPVRMVSALSDAVSLVVFAALYFPLFYLGLKKSRLEGVPKIGDLVRGRIFTG